MQRTLIGQTKIEPWQVSSGLIRDAETSRVLSERLHFTYFTVSGCTILFAPTLVHIPRLRIDAKVD